MDILLNYLILFKLCSQSLALGPSMTWLAIAERDLAYFCSDALEGRAPNTLGDSLSQAYLLNEFKAAGLKAWPDFPNYKQDIFFDSIKTANLLACTAWRPHHAKVLITAHFDHLGTNWQGAIFRGADDNASGLVVLLALARSLGNWGRHLKVDVLLVALGGHELGLHGSQFLCNYLDNQKIKIDKQINLDMVGRLDKDQPRLIVRHGEELRDFAWLDLGFRDFAFWPKLLEGQDLDHSCLSRKGVLALSLSTGIHEDYHRITDTTDKINFKGLFKIWRFLHSFILNQLSEMD